MNNDTSSKNPMLLHAEEQHVKSLHHGTHVHLITDLIIELREKGIITTLPHITIDEINDKSNSDAFVWVIAIFQIISMAAQILIRYTKDLAVSQLEIAVIAFAVCAIIIYISNWHKPQGVKISMTILSYDTMIPEDVEKIFVEYQSTIESKPTWISAFGSHYKVARKVNNSWIRGHSDLPEVLGLILGSIAFGGVYIFAWEFTFPTPFEQIAWRVASVFCTCAVPAPFFVLYMLLILMRNSYLYHFLYDWYRVCVGITGFSLPLLYFLARMFMVMEMFRCLLYLPLSAYISTWAANIPQIS